MSWTTGVSQKSPLTKVRYEGIGGQSPSGNKRAQERPLHQVERELRARLWPSIQNREA